jgi:hypothetical protein
MAYKDPVRQKEWHKQWHIKNREAQIKKMALYRKVLRTEVLNKYANGNIVCACCGEDKVEFLSLDHINGGGTKHRKLVGAGFKFFLWLRKNDYPEGYRILCHNCNQSYGFYNYCPHTLPR